MEKRNSGIKYWIILICCCLMTASSIGIVVNTIGVFYTPVSTALGVSQGTFTLHATFCLLATALTALFVPGIMKKNAIKINGFNWCSFNNSIYICNGVGS